MLTIKGLTGGYNASNQIHDISIEVPVGKVVSILGANGAGKTTTLRAISGTLLRVTGSIIFDGQDLIKMRADQRSELGLAHVPEGRRVFSTLSVYDNLLLGGWTRKNKSSDAFDKVMWLFPRLKERLTQVAGTLSGGEQQMLAIGRALMSEPKMLILDEPSMGLSPKYVIDVFAKIATLRAEGMTMLIVDQFPKRVLALSDYAYVLQRGEVAIHGLASDLLSADSVGEAYLS